ncbi:MAG: hotdog fold thioesterase [Candidatus Marinimicrobia bacterium]|nr:hotdog fold thioesterase [Candidatus Neomarinimicrobiota bacterium]MCH8068404.1 hotdog fold thioesterase [Candidatus Neomarinimicrobiota bacterium]
MEKNEILNRINTGSANSMVSHLGIEITDIGEDFVTGKMPVDERTKHPLDRLHGGASVAFAETLGSIAASMQVNFPKEIVVGLEINANHVKSVRNGWVYGTAKPVHIGKRTQVWDIRITNAEDELVCTSRLTVSVVKKNIGQKHQNA